MHFCRFLLFCGLSALIQCPASLWACTLVFLLDIDSKACLTAVLWCCGFVRLWLWSWGPFPFFFNAFYISLFLWSYWPSEPWVLIFFALCFWITAIMQVTVPLRGFGLTEVLVSYKFTFSPLYEKKKKSQVAKKKVKLKIRIKKSDIVKSE